MNYSLQHIAKILNAKIIGNGNAEIKYLLTDSRAVSFPEESLFFALRTARNDGHRYIEELYARNVRNFVVSTLSNFPEGKEHSPFLWKELGEEVNFILVENPLAALQKLAAHHRARFSCPVIGITGSNGKTIVKEWLYQLLHKDYAITRSPRSYNSQTGAPLSVWNLPLIPSRGEGETLCIFEAGISQPGEMEKLEAIIKPTIGIFTHLGDAHQENFASLKEKCSEKLKLFKNSEILIYNKDNKLIDISIAQSGIKAKPFTWGKNKDADIQIVDIKKESNKTTIVYTCPKFKIQNSKFTINFTDDASIENALHCLAVLLYLGIPSFQNLENLEPVAMRLELKEGINNSVVIDDAYNSDLTSLSIALDFLEAQTASNNMKRTLILSDILQSGQSPAELYQTVSELIKNKGIQQFIGIGREMKNEELRIKNIFGTDCQSIFFETTEEFLHSSFFIHHSSFSNSCILLKGSRSYKFETISEKLQAIVHQTTLEVDLNALIHNVNYFRSHLLPETKIMNVVKACAYGSGDVEVARTLQHHGCDYLAVAVADEGAALRAAGIRIPIVVMNPEQGSYAKILEHRLEPEIYSFALLDAFMKETQKHGETNYPIHIKIDTGMHRLGFELDEVDTLIEKLSKQQTLLVRSVFTHLAGTDDAQFDAFTEEQVSRFRSVADKFDAAFKYKILKHALNSAGIERFPQHQFDMVRLGIGHYGISAVDNAKLQEVCTLKTTILQIKKVPASETVGYSRKGKLTRDTVVAAIPIGYADGYNRRLSNGAGKVLVNGFFAPIIGNICMDVCMIDITGIPACEGDEVILFGKEYSINEIAKTSQTIPYEVLSSISRRVKRVYFKE